MTGTQDQLVEFEKLLTAKQKELLRKQNDIYDFVDTKHRARATKKYQKEVRALAKEVNDFIILLIETKENTKDKKEFAEKLCDKGMGLNGLVKDLSQALANDLAKRQHDETVDIVKIVSIVSALTVAALTVSRYTFDPQSSHAIAEASAGATVGFVVGSWKPICGGFAWVARQLCAMPRRILKGVGLSLKAARRVGKEICSLPSDIKNSLMLYYMKDVAKETVQRFVKLRGEKKVCLPNAVNDDQPKIERGEIKRTGTDPDAPKI